jgi:hypothetical protein
LARVSGWVSCAGSTAAPVGQHFVVDLARLFFGPVANAVCSERFVEPKDTVAPLADTGWCENHWIEQVLQHRDLALENLRWGFLGDGRVDSVRRRLLAGRRPYHHRPIAP